MESVWDYPRPPRVEAVDWRVRVIDGDEVIVDAPHAFRVLETSQPPAYYVAAKFVDMSRLVASDHRTGCEWKGVADYTHLLAPGSSSTILRHNVAWRYPSPAVPFGDIAGHWAFYAQKFDRCLLDDEEVQSNDGGFYGGWITENVTGPFKGGPGTLHW